MRNGIGVPSFGKHRDGDDAAYSGTQTSFLADSIHHLPQQFLIAYFFGTGDVAGPLDDLAAEALDFVPSYLTKILFESFSRFELFAVDQQRIWPGKRVAVLIVIPEQLEAALFKVARAVFFFALKAGDVIVNQLGGRGIVAHYNEAGRHLDAPLRPQFVGFGVMTVEGLKRGLKFDRNTERIEMFGLTASLFRHPGAYVLPQVAELGHFAARNVVSDRDAGQLDDSGLDRVHQGEIA